MKKLIPVAIALLAASVVLPAQAATLVPSGNRSVEQPPIPGASSRRTQATSTTFEAKYRKIYALLKNDPALRGKIRQVSAAYGIDPIQFGVMVGLNLSIGLITPPYGICLFVASMVAGRKVEEVVSKVWIPLIPMVIVLALTAYVPDVVLSLPKAVYP